MYCGGDGVVTTSGSNDGVPFENSRPCANCGGTGKRALGYVTIEPSLEDIMDKCNDIKEKVDEIMEKLNEA